MWHPKGLYDAVLRQAVFQLSFGRPKESVAREAVTKYRSIAANPGLDIMGDPWTIAGDYCAMLSTQVEAISRTVLLPLRPGGVVKLGEMEWEIQAFRDELGQLHRWATVERVDQDALSRELHGWSIWGDLAAADAPMVLHLVEIGRMREGRRHSPWARALKNPVIAGSFRFARREGRKFGPEWKPVFYADSRDSRPEPWVDLMESDGLNLIHHLDVKQPTPSQREESRRQIVMEAARANILKKEVWESIPMSRGECDGISPCPWQSACYGPPSPDLEALGFVRIESNGE